jgi:hypothetical protein
MGGCRDPAKLDQIRKILEDGGDRRPPLQQWLMANYTDLDAMLSDARPNWERLTEAFMGMGFRNLDGSDLRPSTVRQAWYRVRRRKQFKAAGRANPGPTVEVLSPTDIPADDPLAAIRAEMNRRSGRT